MEILNINDSCDLFDFNVSNLGFGKVLINNTEKKLPSRISDFVCVLDNSKQRKFVKKGGYFYVNGFLAIFIRLEEEYGCTLVHFELCDDGNYKDSATTTMLCDYLFEGDTSEDAIAEIVRSLDLEEIVGHLPVAGTSLSLEDTDRIVESIVFLTPYEDETLRKVINFIKFHCPFRPLEKQVRARLGYLNSADVVERGTEIRFYNCDINDPQRNNLLKDLFFSISKINTMLLVHGSARSMDEFTRQSFNATIKMTRKKIKELRDCIKSDDLVCRYVFSILEQCHSKMPISRLIKTKEFDGVVSIV